MYTANLEKKYKTGIVLSGGGARGFAHIGALKAFEENGLKPDVISGTSAGAIIGVLYADGNSPEEIMEILKNYKLVSFMRISIPRDGLLKMHGLLVKLKKTLIAKTFDELKIPLFTCATDFLSGKVRFFSEGELLKPVLASATIPILFKPVLIDDIPYVDGGLISNLPVEPIEDDCKLIIGVNANTVGKIEKTGNILDVVDRTIRLSYRENILRNIPKCDLYLEPPSMQDYRLLDLSRSKEIMEKSYSYTSKILERYSEIWDSPDLKE
jgi:NTE family protein